MNDNVLKGIRCPKCKQEDTFHIAATCWAEVTDEGIDSAEMYEWEDSSSCLCGACNHQGTVADFTVKKKRIKK